MSDPASLPTPDPADPADPPDPARSFVDDLGEEADDLFSLSATVAAESTGQMLDAALATWRQESGRSSYQSAKHRLLGDIGPETQVDESSARALERWVELRPDAAPILHEILALAALAEDHPDSDLSDEEWSAVMAPLASLRAQQVLHRATPRGWAWTDRIHAPGQPLRSAARWLAVLAATAALAGVLLVALVAVMSWILSW